MGGPNRIAEDTPAEVQRVLDACRAMISRGKIPSVNRLNRLALGIGGARLQRIRDRLRDLGLLDWSAIDHLAPGYGDRMLPCDTEAQRDLIKARAELVRRRIDPDTGGPLPEPRQDHNPRRTRPPLTVPEQLARQVVHRVLLPARGEEVRP
jgi:hypothetical protein